MLLPEHNNFATAQQEQLKVGRGAGYFAVLILILLASSTAGLELLAMLSRWRDYGVLQSVGFSPSQILVVYGGQVLVVLLGAIFSAGLLIMLTPDLAGSRTAFAEAALLATGATVVGVVPALWWPVRIPPADMLKELQ
jgi:ABC-type antimicrobial peptide transport system permease subunit